MTTRIYLDVDGVLNAVQREFPSDSWQNWDRVGVNGYSIAYSPDMVAALNEIAEMDDVEFVWLTTWQANAKTMIAPAIGLKGEDWDVALNPDMDAHGFAVHRYFGGWWKMTTLDEHLHYNPVDKVVWIDDDISNSMDADDWFHDFDEETLAISPYTETGLTPSNICDIIDFINAG